MSVLAVNPCLTFDRRRRMHLNIDVVGNCNLRCPSCPVGNIGAINPNGLVDVDLFTRLIDKAVAEYNLSHIELYNWAEPLLHPELPRLIRIVKNHDIPCWLSSNLNILRNPDELLRANPDFLRISLSGFTQPIYGQGHVSGNIERVKTNMRLLSEARQRVGNAHTNIEVFYHKYKYNLHEVEQMRQYAISLGFRWSDVYAYYFPVENLIKAAEGTLDSKETQYVKDTFALPIVEALDAAKAFKQEPCSLWESQIVLDLQGNAVVCCGVYDYKENNLGNFLDLTPEELMKAKAKNATCGRCTSHGIHRYFEFFSHPKLGPIYQDLVNHNLAAATPQPV